MRLWHLTILGLAGCWPRIEGPWADYDVPNDTRILGQVLWLEPQGDYWDDNSPSGFASLAWLEDLQPGLSPRGLIHPTGNFGCETGQIDTDWLNDVIGELPGVDEVQLRAPTGPVVLEGNGYYIAPLTEDNAVPNNTFTLDPMVSDDGTFFVKNFAVLPQPITMNGPALDGDTPESVNYGDITYTWEPTKELDYIVLTAYLYSSGSFVQQVTCLADPKAGQVTVFENEWDDMENGNQVYLDIGFVVEQGGRVEGDTGSSRVVGEWVKRGVLELE